MTTKTQAMRQHLITDDMLRAAVAAMKPDRIQGFLYKREAGPTYVIRDVYRHPRDQEIWSCLERDCDRDEWEARCEMERLRVGMVAALKTVPKEPPVTADDRDELEKLRERCEAYKRQALAASQEIERLTALQRAPDMDKAIKAAARAMWERYIVQYDQKNLPPWDELPDNASELEYTRLAVTAAAPFLGCAQIADNRQEVK